MKFKFLSIAVVGFVLSISSLLNTAQAGLITFDDTSSSLQNSATDVASIAGFDFSSTLDIIDLVGSSWNYGAHSGEFGLLNNNGGIGYVTASDNSDFTFDGLWVQSWGNVSSLTGTLQGFDDGILVWSVNTNISNSYQYIGAQAGMIDSLALGFGNHFLVDDLALNMQAQSVPEPTTLAIFALGLLGFSARRIKK
jgi:hypothetical protein